MKKKFWELGGTVMGSLIGVEKSAEDKAAEAAEGGAELNEDGSVDFKHSNQVCVPFASISVFLYLYVSLSYFGFCPNVVSLHYPLFLSCLFI